MFKSLRPAWAGHLPRHWGWWLGGAVLAAALALSALLTPAAPNTLANLPTTEQPPTPSLVADASLAVSVLLKLGAVIVLIYGSLFWVRRWQGGAWAIHPKQLNIIETTRLSPRQALHIIRAGERTLLIGATDQSLTLLTELEPFTAVLDAAQQEMRREA